MMMLAGAAMTALDGLLSLVSASSATGAGNRNTAAAATFNLPGSSTGAVAGGGSAAGGNVPALSAGTMNALLSLQGRPGSTGDPASWLFSLIDTDRDGTISKSEFATGLAVDATTGQADAAFSTLDDDEDGTISQPELTAALQHRGHHHPHRARPAAAPSDSDGSDTVGSIGATSSKTSTNADGSTTTTIRYADGSQVTTTTPAGASGGAAGHPLERLIARQARMLSATAPGGSVAMSV
jgi:hypothetical protein